MGLTPMFMLRDASSPFTAANYYDVGHIAIGWTPYLSCSFPDLHGFLTKPADDHEHYYPMCHSGVQFKLQEEMHDL